MKLIKWRLIPELELEKISGLRCLLLGAGTLGCSVARVLLGWGVTTITFIDSSVVSYSNTARQSLYTHENAVQRRNKAEAARDALLEINPSLVGISRFKLLHSCNIKQLYTRLPQVRCRIEI